jgi:hypothetical protein
VLFPVAGVSLTIPLAAQEVSVVARQAQPPNLRLTHDDFRVIGISSRKPSVSLIRKSRRGWISGLNDVSWVGGFPAATLPSSYNAKG